MKKIVSILFATVLIISLASCAKDTKSKNDSNNDGKVDAEDVVQDALEEAEEYESFSIEAVENFFSKAVKIELSSVEPDWEWKLKSDYSAYGDDPSSSYGHAVIQFTKADGELTDDEYNAWLEKVFQVTANASDDGYNIIGYEFVGEGEDALSETTLEDAVGGFMSGWAFRKDGSIMAVYVSNEYDSDKESTTGSLFYYDGVKLDIGFGLQKDMNDYFEDIEENEDEIEDALDEYLN